LPSKFGQINVSLLALLTCFGALFSCCSLLCGSVSLHGRLGSRADLGLNVGLGCCLGRSFLRCANDLDLDIGLVNGKPTAATTKLSVVASTWHVASARDWIVGRRGDVCRNAVGTVAFFAVLDSGPRHALAGAVLNAGVDRHAATRR
jgi:hypothetical protein